MNKVIKIFLVVLFFVCVVFGALYYSYTKQHKIVFIGDSITFFGEDMEKGFIRQFREAMPQRIEIIPAGICGETTDQIKARMDSDVIANKPDVVFIMAGINNIWPIDDPNIEAAKQDMADMIDIAKSNHIEPIILNITLYTEDLNYSRNLNIYKYNDSLAELAKEKNVQLIDVNAAFKEEIAKRGDTNIVLSEDDLHLNDYGNTVIANLLLKEFKKTHALKWMLF